MELIFARQSGETILRHAYCEIPFKVTRVLNSRGGPARLILMQCSAGLFGGDQLECSIHVERGAHVWITQQSATKVHPSRGRPAVQRHRFIVENSAELQVYFEPVIPFADASLRQSTQLEVETGGRVVFWEGLMAGRIGRGERWRFRELASETSVRVNGRLVYLERFLLPNGIETSNHAMGECNYLGSGLVVGEDAAVVASRLHTALPDAGVDTPAPQLAVIRVVSPTGPEFHHSRELFMRHSGRVDGIRCQTEDR
jgi:urease accessory protein